jgi:hypothetical protein
MTVARLVIESRRHMLYGVMWVVASTAPAVPRLLRARDLGDRTDTEARVDRLRGSSASASEVL